MDAMISGRGGLALVVDGDHLASIHAAEPEATVPRERSEVHLLLGEAQDFVAVENVPRQEVVRQLALAQDREHALQLALILLDPDLPDDIRQDGSGELEELFAQEDLIVYVESVLYAKPLPEGSDLPGGLALARAPGTRKVMAMLGKLEACQPVIAEVRRAWEAIPSECFGGEEQHWQFVAIREGLFRQLVLHRMSGSYIDTFFDDTSLHPALRSLPNCREVLRAWSWLEQVAAADNLVTPYETHELWAQMTKQPQVVREERSEYGKRNAQKDDSPSRKDPGDD